MANLHITYYITLYCILYLKDLLALYYLLPKCPIIKNCSFINRIVCGTSELLIYIRSCVKILYLLQYYKYIFHFVNNR